VQIIIKSPFLVHTQLLFHDLNLLKIQDICKLEIAKSMHHCTGQNKVKIVSQQAILNWPIMFTFMTQVIPQKIIIFNKQAN